MIHLRPPVAVTSGVKYAAQSLATGCQGRAELKIIIMLVKFVVAIWPVCPTIFGIETSRWDAMHCAASQVSQRGSGRRTRGQVIYVLIVSQSVC